MLKNFYIMMCGKAYGVDEESELLKTVMIVRHLSETPAVRFFRELYPIRSRCPLGTPLPNPWESPLL